MDRTICLFDVDGTLTVPRKEAEPEMLAFLQELRKVRASPSRHGDACVSSHAHARALRRPR